MEFTIKNTSYELKFGFKFIEELDKKYKSPNGDDFGLEVLTAGLYTRDYKVIVDAIFFGLCHLDAKPSRKDIEQELEDYLMTEKETLDEMCERFLGKFKNHPITSARVKVMDRNMKKFKELEQKRLETLEQS